MYKGRAFCLMLVLRGSLIKDQGCSRRTKSKAPKHRHYLPVRLAAHLLVSLSASLHPTLAGRLSLSQLALGWQRAGTWAPLERFRVHVATDGRIDKSLPAKMKPLHCLQRLYFFLLQLAQRLHLDQIVILIIFFIYIALIKTEIVPHISYKELIKPNKYINRTHQNQPLEKKNF